MPGMRCAGPCQRRHAGRADRGMASALGHLTRARARLAPRSIVPVLDALPTGAAAPRHDPLPIAPEVAGGLDGRRIDAAGIDASASVSYLSSSSDANAVMVRCRRLTSPSRVEVAPYKRISAQWSRSQD